MAAQVEGAAALARRAAQAAAGRLPAKSSRRFDAAGLAAISRVNARDVALSVATDGLRWVVGSQSEAVAGEFDAALGLEAIRAAQAGLVADMDAVAEHVYRAGRAKP
jgi:hypothetical protein